MSFARTDLRSRDLARLRAMRLPARTWSKPSLPKVTLTQKGTEMSDVADRIETMIKGQDVVLFMKGTPQFPQCGFSSQVVQILDHLEVPFASADVLADAELRQGIKAFTNWPTVPQLYVRGAFVGGCDIVREMFQTGELQTLLEPVTVAAPMPASF